ncbi:hypothetical protein AcW1_005326 [Taiwanofungus camphoratus]|nr:hypothetical protein AcW1_005326 [Antrodia cinnamomea]
MPVPNFESTEPAAFLLLTLPDVTLQTSDAKTSGALALECVTLTSPPDKLPGPTLTDDVNEIETKAITASLSSEDRSVYLVLRLHPLELPLDPTCHISLSISPDGTRTYTFHSDDSPDNGASSIRLSIHPSTADEPSRAEDIGTFEHIIAQYADLSRESTGDSRLATESSRDSSAKAQRGPDAEEDLRGRLVLMDEANGDIVAELPQKLSITEDPELAHEDRRQERGQDEKEASPVVLELPEDMYDAYTGEGTHVITEGTNSELADAREIFVHAVPPEEQDWITKSATFISRAIDSSTSLLVNGITSASRYYINNSAPSPQSTNAVGSFAPSSSKASPHSAADTNGNDSQQPPRSLLLLTSPRTQAALSHAYAISGQAARVSQRTVALVESMIRRTVSSSSAEQQVSGSNAKELEGQNIIAQRPKTPPPPYITSPASGAQGYVENPPLPPLRNVSTGPSGLPLPPRTRPSSPHTSGKSAGAVASQQDSSSANTLTDQTQGQPLRTRDKLWLSANLVFATVDDSARRVWDVGSERLGAVVGHKSVLSSFPMDVLSANSLR